MVLLSPLIIPDVTVLSKSSPSGFPIATASSPILRSSESPISAAG